MKTLNRDEIHEAILNDVYEDAILNTTYQRLLNGEVQEAIGDLVKSLFERRVDSVESEWSEFARLALLHPVRELLHQDPLTKRAFEKPRGYAGDAACLDLVYGREEGYSLPEDTSELGREIFEITSQFAASQGVLARREVIVKTIEQTAERVKDPAILSVACGHLREASLSTAFKRGKVGACYALDSDAESLEEVQRCYHRYNIEIVPASIRRLLTGDLELPTFDLIYSTGLFDYLQDRTARRLTDRLFAMLKPGGRLLLANYLPEIMDIGYMESYMDWHLIYRTRQDMMNCTMSIAQAEIDDIRIFTEENENIIFLELVKSA